MKKFAQRFPGPVFRRAEMMVFYAVISLYATLSFTVTCFTVWFPSALDWESSVLAFKTVSLLLRLVSNSWQFSWLSILVGLQSMSYHTQLFFSIFWNFVIIVFWPDFSHCVALNGTFQSPSSCLPLGKFLELLPQSHCCWTSCLSQFPSYSNCQDFRIPLVFSFSCLSSCYLALSSFTHVCIANFI